jgi:hypothetical protein
LGENFLAKRWLPGDLLWSIHTYLPFGRFFTQRVAQKYGDFFQDKIAQFGAYQGPPT